MSFLQWKKDKLKIGKITFFKVKSFQGMFIYYFLGIPVWSRTTPISRIIYEFQKNKNFDTRNFDKELERIIPPVKSMDSSPYTTRVSVLATELYDNGGHSKCIQDLMDILNDKYTQSIFLTSYSSSWKYAPQIMSYIKKFALISGKDIGNIRWKKDTINLFYDICNFSPKVIFVFIHPDDIYGTLLLSMIKKYTKIKVYYCPHASHYPNLGISFADIILEGMPVTAYVTQKLRKCLKTHVVGILSKRLKQFPTFTAEEILACRRSLGVSDVELCTISGGSSYKFFDSSDTSEYFKVIKHLLDRNQNVKHIIISNFSETEKVIIEKIFEGSKSRNRLIIHPLTPEYELIFCCADVFIDSFPVSAALTMIDLMRLKVPAVVKINRENALWSFHEYQRPDFPYMYDNNKDFLRGIEKLLSSKILRKIEMDENYQFYLDRYEGESCKLHLYELIDNSDMLELYYTQLNSEIVYQFKGIS